MIIGLFGKPGSGKSYEAVYIHIQEALKKNWYVRTNIPLDLEAIGKDHPDADIDVIRASPDQPDPFSVVDHFPNEDFVKDKAAEQGGSGKILLVIDEAQEVLRPRKHYDRLAKKQIADLEQWFAWHRHFAINVILISQSPKGLNPSIAQKIESFIHLRTNKLLFGKHSNSYRRLVSHSGSVGEGDRFSIRQLDKKNFARGWYSSTVFGGGDEAYLEDVPSFWSRPVFLAIPLFFIPVIYIFYNYGSPFSLVGGLLDDSPVDEIEVAAPAATSVSPQSRSFPALVLVSGKSDTHQFFIQPADDQPVQSADQLRRAGWIVTDAGRALVLKSPAGDIYTLQIPNR